MSKIHNEQIKPRVTKFDQNSRKMTESNFNDVIGIQKRPGKKTENPNKNEQN